MGATGEGGAVPGASCPRARSPRTAKPGGFGVSKVLCSLLTPLPPLCAANCLPLEVGQRPQEASEDTQNLSRGPKTRARWAGGTSCLPLTSPASTAEGQAWWKVRSRRAGLCRRRGWREPLLVWGAVRTRAGEAQRLEAEVLKSLPLVGFHPLLSSDRNTEGRKKTLRSWGIYSTSPCLLTLKRYTFCKSNIHTGVFHLSTLDGLL